MSPLEFARALEQIGWSERQFAERIGASRWQVSQWNSGQRPMPEAIAGWLRSLAAFHRSVPPPKWADTTRPPDAG